MKEQPTIRNYVHDIPWDDISGHLVKIGSQISEFIRTAGQKIERTNENVLFIKCLEKARGLVQMFQSSWESNLIGMCVATRSMLELNLLIRKFETDPEYRLKFLYTALWQEEAIINNFLKLNSNGFAAKTLKERLSQLKDIEKRHKLERASYEIKKINWDLFAKRFNIADDYDTIYRYSSIILHITPLSIFRIEDMLEEKSEKDALLNMFLVMFQVYLFDAVKRISDILNVQVPSFGV